MKVLVADGDISLLEITAFALHRHGHDVITVPNGSQVIRRWGTDQPDVAVLDVDLPEVSGLEVCRRIRREEDTPIILLGTRQDDDSIEEAFNVGADDYLAKPFSHRQLLIRLQAVTRRRPAPFDGPKHDGRLVVGHLVLNVHSHEVWRGDLTTRLTPIEFRILYMLATNEGHVVPSQRLADYAWGFSGGDPSQLKVHVYQVRRKLRMQKGKPGTIESVPCVGYVLSDARGCERAS